MIKCLNSKINFLFLFVVLLSITVSYCSLFDSDISCNQQKNGFCLEIVDAGNVEEGDVESWCKEQNGEYADEGCSDDGLQYTCENLEDSTYTEVTVNGESKGNLSEIIYYFYKTEIEIPLSDDQTLKYLDSKDFCDDVGGEHIEAE